MPSEPLPASTEGLELLDLDILLKDVAPLTTPHDWAAPDLFPDDAEFDEFVQWVRTERSTNLT